MSDITTAYNTMTSELNDAMSKENKKLKEENEKLWDCLSKCQTIAWSCEEGDMRTIYQNLDKELKELPEQIHKVCEELEDRQGFVDPEVIGDWMENEEQMMVDKDEYFKLKEENEALKAEGGVKTHYQEVMRKQQTEMDKEHIRYLEKVQEVGELKDEMNQFDEELRFKMMGGVITDLKKETEKLKEELDGWSDYSQFKGYMPLLVQWISMFGYSDEIGGFSLDDNELRWEDYEDQIKDDPSLIDRDEIIKEAENVLGIGDDSDSDSDEE
jgi:FtsZ-binding cell division protein ZapB